MEGTSSPGGESVEGSWVLLMAMSVAVPAITLSTRAQPGRRSSTKSSSTPSGGDNSSDSKFLVFSTVLMWLVYLVLATLDRII